MMCFGGGVGRSMDVPSVCPSVTQCALQLARGHSNGEQVYLRMQLQATMYSCVLNRTVCAAWQLSIIKYQHLAHIWLVCSNRVAGV